MAEKLDVFNTAVSLLIRAALLAARFAERVRKRSLKGSPMSHLRGTEDCIPPTGHRTTSPLPRFVSACGKTINN
jgi:hypothetical protein